MKKEELRIGNWYLSVKFGVPVRCELSDLYELCVMSDGAYNDPPIGEMFEPIPLTEKWLVKFRYEYKDYGWQGKWHYIDEFTDSVFTCDKTGVNILYVHQLQNLYFVLTKEELKTA